MFSETVIYLILIGYMLVMYMIANWGDNHSIRNNQKLRPWVYGLSLAVYCSSWTFYGAVGTAVRSGWDFLPIYLGPILLFTFGWPMVLRIIKVSKENHVTSLSDFVASLYKQSRPLAIMVTVVAVISSIPYITLQIRAIAASIEILTPQDTAIGYEWVKIAFIALLLALFSMAFGTRKFDVTEHHRGLMLAIAFESVLKLVVFVVLGLFAFYTFPQGVSGVFDKLQDHQVLSHGPNLSINFITQTFLALAVFMCLPRQFHVTVIENEKRSDLSKARWMFVIYLLIVSVLVVPIALAGMNNLPTSIAEDWYVLQIPKFFDHTILTLMVFLGGLAASTGMVIIATIALSTMISNDIVIPYYLKWHNYQIKHNINIQGLALWSRRISILFISLIALLFYLQVSHNFALAALGQLSFLSMVQFAPAIFLGLYWKKADQKAAMLGLLTGFITLFCLLAFVIPDPHTSTSFLSGFLNSISQLTQKEPPLFELFFYSTGVNLLTNLVVGFGNHWRSGKQTINQADAILSNELNWSHLRQLVSQVIGKNYAKESFNQFQENHSSTITDDSPLSPAMIQFTEKLLAGVIGTSSSRTVLTTLLKRRGLGVDEVVRLMDQTKEAIKFNRILTDATLDHISQAVCVVDSELRLLAWNRQYHELLNFPEGFLSRGMPIEKVLRFNAERGYLNMQSDRAIERRLIYLKQRRHHRHETQLPNGQSIEIEGHPMPNGGYVSTFNDITHYKNIQIDLEKTQAMLEKRVAERTVELSTKNVDLAQAIEVAEQANRSKTKFIADASHDLLQPFNAARLFTSILSEQKNQIPAPLSTTVDNLDQSLRSAENLLSALLDIAQFDAGGVRVDKTKFALQPLFEHINNQYQNKAMNKGLNWKVVENDFWIYSDRKLVYRVLQNLVSNAIKYTKSGTVLITANRIGDQIKIRVMDSGIGMSATDLSQIYNEFTRLTFNSEQPGLGLGLSIVERISKELDLNIVAYSKPDKGSVFTFYLPLSDSQGETETAQKVSTENNQKTLHRVMCIDNEISILKGMSQLMTGWGFEVATCQDAKACHADIKQYGIPDLLLVDYQLDVELGTDVIKELFKQHQFKVPVIIITANHDEQFKNEVEKLGYQLLLKPIKPIKLRQMINQISNKQPS